MCDGVVIELAVFETEALELRECCLREFVCERFAARDVLELEDFESGETGG